MFEKKKDFQNTKTFLLLKAKKKYTYNFERKWNFYFMLTPHDLKTVGVFGVYLYL